MNNTKYEIFVGLNKDKKLVFSYEGLVKQITSFFKEYKIDFSLNKQFGGYVYEDGTYEIEDCAKLTFIGKRSVSDEDEFFNKLKKKFNQESILVVKKTIISDFVGD